MVEGSASGALEGLTGKGDFEAPMGSKATFELEYTLA